MESTHTYFAVFGRNGFAGVSAVKAVYTVGKFIFDQGSIFPATFHIRQAHPLAQVLRLVGGGRRLVNVGC